MGKLCLTIKRGEPVEVGSMAVTITEAHGDYYRVTFDGPRDIPVTRHNAKNKEKRKETT